MSICGSKGIKHQGKRWDHAVQYERIAGLLLDKYFKKINNTELEVKDLLLGIFNRGISF
jgi:hypothetical protein